MAGKKRNLKKLLKTYNNKRIKAAATPTDDVALLYDFESNETITDGEEEEIEEEPEEVLQYFLDMDWTEEAESTRYVHKFKEHDKTTKRKIRQNAKDAAGSRKITSFFTTEDNLSIFSPRYAALDNNHIIGEEIESDAVEKESESERLKKVWQTAVNELTEKLKVKSNMLYTQHFPTHAHDRNCLMWNLCLSCSTCDRHDDIELATQTSWGLLSCCVSHCICIT